MTTQTLPLETIDVHQYGKSHTGAAYWIRSPHAALVECGTASSAPLLLRRLQGTRLAYLFVTHVHLDHAGGTGILAAAHPEATIVCHPRAVRHLVDPTRLIEGTRRASPDLFVWHATPIPVPEERIRPAEDGETFSLGGQFSLQAVHSPGHAPHHVCYYEPSHRLLFAGDALGSYDVPIACPFTVPPHYDLEAGNATVRSIRRLRPRRIAFTHYGIADDAAMRIVAYGESVPEWMDMIDRLRKSVCTTESVIARVLDQPEYSQLDSVDRSQVALCVRGALMTLAAG